MGSKPIYLDCAATTPIDPEVREVILQYLDIDFGNAGSRTHTYGTTALKAVNRAREQVASIVTCEPEEVIFTSGATESNNLATLGLAETMAAKGKRHIISTAIEHKAVLEPLECLARRGFSVQLVPPRSDGRVDAERILSALTDDTSLVSVMHVNNETGVIQPIDEIAEGLRGKDVYFHIDAAQGFGKDIQRLRHPRIDMISISGHKIFAPKGVGALVVRRRERRRLPLAALQFGGGQERGLRPGTQAVHLIAALGKASEVALRGATSRWEQCTLFREGLLAGLASLNPLILSQAAPTLPSIINLRFPGVDAEAVMLTLKELVAISNGSACTTDRVEPSHVLLAQGLSQAEAYEATRWSWSHSTDQVAWADVSRAIQRLL